MQELKTLFSSPEKLLTLLQNNKRFSLLLLAGLILVGGGVLLFTKDFSGLGGNKVEILGESTGVATTSGELVVEVSGAVENPGVYKLSSGSRVNDLLVAAGGLSVSADRNWVEKTINKAAKLVDGQKIFIRSQGEGGNVSYEVGNEGGGVEVGGLININSASQKKLESLPGIGPVYAANIIEQRPYSTVSELQTKKIIPQKTFDKIKDKISVY